MKRQVANISEGVCNKKNDLFNNGHTHVIAIER